MAHTSHLGILGSPIPQDQLERRSPLTTLLPLPLPNKGRGFSLHQSNGLLLFLGDQPDLASFQTTSSGHNYFNFISLEYVSPRFHPDFKTLSQIWESKPFLKEHVPPDARDLSITAGSTHTLAFRKLVRALSRCPFLDLKDSRSTHSSPFWAMTGIS